MYLSKISIKNFRVFSDAVEVSFSKGLNLLVGENGSGKSTAVDAIRALLGENEFSRRGIIEEDFYSVFCESQKKSSESLFISGVFSNLTEAQKVEYLSWLDEDFNAKLSFEVQRTLNRRNNYKQKRWGGNSSNSFFDIEPLNDIQCVYLPALRDAERRLRTGRGSRLARFIANLSADDLKSKREKDELMPLEQDLKEFNEKAANESEIKNATELINSSIMSAVGNVYGQKTQIRFNILSYERIIESLQLLFSDDLSSNLNIFRSLSENSLGYNNLIYIATILAEFEGLKDRYTTPRILLIEELEAHLHPQLQIKLLQYLQKQATEFDIQVIITTHSSLLAASVPFESIIALYKTEEGISITPLIDCGVDKSASGFLNRWLDATKTALFFSKGNIFVEGIAEAILIPELAKVYLRKQNEDGLTKVTSLEEAGISVINMNAIIVSVQKKLIADSAVTDLNKTWSTWKKTLASCLESIDIIPSHTVELKSIRRGMTDEKVIDTFSNSIDHDISITIETIHGCKGMSLDSVLFVSSYTKSASSSGAHWRDWFQHNETGISEAHRLAYVAFSRAKHLLALGIPNPPSAPLSEADKQMLTDCGFEIVEIAED